MALLTCDHLSFSYDGVTVLSDVTFAVSRGDYVCIAGENGSGKSTLIKGLLRLKVPSSGEIATGDGLKLNEIGYLPQQTPAQRDFPASVDEVVLSGCQNRSHRLFSFYTREDRLIAHRQMTLLGIESLGRQCYRNLSGGQQQRVLLARALCAGQALLLLDEPVTGLDPVVTKEFYQLLRQLNQEHHLTILMVTHDLRGVIDDASHILHLGHRQLFFGTSADYRASDIGRQFLAGGNWSDETRGNGGGLRD